MPDELKDHLDSLLRKQFREVLETTWNEVRISQWSALSGPEWWITVRDGIVTPILIEAAVALKHYGLYASQTGSNTSGTELETGRDHHPPHSSLTFSFVQDQDKIRVTSSETDLRYSWDNRREFSEEAVISKVKQFLERVAVRYPKPRFTSGIA